MRFTSWPIFIRAEGSMFFWFFFYSYLLSMCNFVADDRLGRLYVQKSSLTNAFWLSFSTLSRRILNSTLKIFFFLILLFYQIWFTFLTVLLPPSYFSTPILFLVSLPLFLPLHLLLLRILVVILLLFGLLAGLLAIFFGT